jgi:PAS domain S-box-containing protein
MRYSVPSLESRIMMTDQPAPAIGVDDVPGLVALLTADGAVDVANHQILEYTGKTLEELRQRGTSDVVHAEDLPHVANVFGRSIASGTPYQIVQRLRRFDGTYRWFLNCGHPLRDSAGVLVGWCVLLTDIDETKRAEDTLRDSERQSREIVDCIPGLVAAFTPAGDVEFVNRQVRDYFGIPIDELKHWGSGGTAHPDDLQRVIDCFTQSIVTGEPFAFEVRARRFDGLYRWFQSRGFPLRSADGQIVRWYNLLIDIDERKRAEALLAGEKRLLEMVALGYPLPAVLHALCELVEAAASKCHCGVYLVDPKGPTFHNGAAPTLPASFNDATDGTPVTAGTGPCGMAASSKTQVIVTDVAADPLWESSTFRLLALAHGLSACWSTPIFSLAGDVLGTFAIYQTEPGTPTSLQQELIGQVTHLASIAIERAQSEAALKRSEAFLAQGQRLTLTGSLWWDVSSGRVIWSDQTYRIMDFPTSIEPTVEHALDRIHPEDRAVVQTMLARSASEGTGIDLEHRLLMPDSTVKHVHVVLQKIDRKAATLEFVGALTDITARKQAEEELRRAQERLNRAGAELARVSRLTTLSALTASMAHEVNQPLSGIITNASTCLRMLDATPPDVDGARETARRTIRDGNRASDVVAKLRQLFSNRDLTLEPLDLNDASREVIALSSSDLQRSRITLQSDLAAQLPSIRGDRIQLQQVILNLLRNAADAMSEVQDRPRTSLIATEADPENVRVTVRDSGVGIAPQSMDSLFDPFFTTKSGGMGIGLFVSRSIVEKHHGRLWAEANDGPGATFSFSIPRALR